MSRPQAGTAFIPIVTNRSQTRPTLASRFMSREQASETHSWYNITSKKSEDKTVASIMIYGEIGWEVTAKEFVKEVTALDADEIEVHINSVGGDVFDGVAIYNALRMHDASVTVYVEGIAASAASFIAQAGDEVIMLRGSEMMIHDASAFAWGNESVMLQTAGILARISNNIADIYAQRAGGTAEEWRALMQAEMWYNPEEAVEAGLADRTIDAISEEAVEAKNSWDLRVFNYSGRSSAPSPGAVTQGIINSVKENQMAKLADKQAGVTASEVEPPATPDTEAPVVDPPAVEDDEEDEGTNQGPSPEGEQSAEVLEASNRAGHVFMVNGSPTTDFAAVQAHIGELESFYNDTRATNRTDFINGLAKGPTPKILATQIEAMEELVATMSDKQYEMWKASWEAAPGVGLLQPHGGQDGGSPAGGAATEASDRVEVLTAIVARHKMAGTPAEKIKATDSYKELIKLQPDFTL